MARWALMHSNYYHDIIFYLQIKYLHFACKKNAVNKISSYAADETAVGDETEKKKSYGKECLPFSN